MKFNLSSEIDTKKLQDRVVLIIDGISERGLRLANMLSEQGADVVIAGLEHSPELMQNIHQDVEANGRRCLVLASTLMPSDEASFSQQVMQRIVSTFGCLDAFISCSAGQATEKIELVKCHQKQNRRPRERFFFDQQGLIKAAIKLILAQ